ncbi:MAG: CsgG/HfaB family protein [Treponema sp.]|nr:CsgG/HfaB family protein [Treponema sp.]
MKKNILTLTLLIGAVMVFAQNAVTLDSALEYCAIHLRNQLPRGARVAVLNIEARSEGFADYVTDSLSAKLVCQNHLTVVERGRARSVLESEQNYQLSGNVSDETAASLGKHLGAELIFTGLITPRGDNYSINIRVVHVETARVQDWI